MLTFIPAGLPRRIAEGIAAVIPGALLLFIFFAVAEGAVFFMGKQSELISIIFVPVICILPVFAGMVSALVLEKVRRQPPTFKWGVAAGAGAGLCGAIASSLMLGTLALLKQAPLGTMVSSNYIVLAVLLATVAIDTILGALGGAVVVKFIKDI